MLKAIMSATLVATIFASPVLAADDIIKKPWNDIVAQAKKEGEVVWY